MPSFGCVSVDFTSVASVEPSIHVLSEAFELKLQLSLKKQIVFSRLLHCCFSPLKMFDSEMKNHIDRCE